VALSTTLRDLRIALRSLRRRKLLSFGVITCLALGIGVNLAVVDLADRLLLRAPPHVRDAEKLFQVRYSMELPGIGPVTASTFSQPTFLDLSRAPGVSGMATTKRMRLPASSSASEIDSGPADISLVSASFFPLLGVSAAKGRFFDDSEVEEKAPVAVLSMGWAETSFEHPKNALGQTIQIAGRVYTVVGLAPRGFRSVDAAPVDIWVPSTSLTTIQGANWRTNRRARSLHLLARVKDPVAAHETLTGVYRRVNEGVTPFIQGSTIELDSIQSLGGRGGAKVAKVLGWLAALSGLVLLIACTNVAGLLIVQALRQRKDLALRLALGAARSTAVLPIIAEIFILVCISGAVSILLLRWLQEGVLRVLLPSALSIERVLDFRSLAVAGSIVLVAILLSVLAALFGFRRVRLAAVLAEDSGGTGAVRLPRLLVGAQVALSVVLLVGAGLFVRSLHQVSMIHLGFDSERLLVATIESGGDDGDDDEILLGVARAAARLPWIDRVAVGAAVPFDSIVEGGGGLKVPGTEVPGQMPGGGPYVDAVTAGYFGTMGIAVRRGRTFASDSQGSASVVINETAARVLWPDETAIGKCIVIPDSGSESCRTVVGIVADTARQTLQDGKAIQIYFPKTAGEWPAARGLFARVSSSEEREAARELRSELQRKIPPGWLAEVRPMEQLVAPELRPWRLGADVFLVFGALGLILSCVGIATSVGQTVLSERRAIGIRMALGAERGRVVRLVVRASLVPVVTGAFVGLGVAFLGAGRLAPLLYEVSARDPLVFGVVALVVLFTTGLASYLAARSAAGVDPAVALRGD